MEKYHKQDVAPIEKENERDENYEASNPQIDSERTRNNYRFTPYFGKTYTEFVNGPQTVSLALNAKFNAGPMTAYEYHYKFDTDLTNKYALSEVKGKWITLELDLDGELWLYNDGYAPSKGKLGVNVTRVNYVQLYTLPPVPGDPPLTLYVDNLRIEK